MLAAATLLAVVVLGAGWLAFHGTDTSTSAPPELRNTATGPTDPGTEGVGVAEPGVSLAGQTRMVDGVPWGWPLTPDGAAAAAMTAHVQLARPDVVIDPDRVEELAAVMFSPEEADRQRRLAEVLRTELEVSGWFDQPASRRMYHVAPLAVSVPRWEPERGLATVEIWSLQLLGVGDTGGASFVTSTAHLQVVDGDWQVAGAEAVEGPTPYLQSRPNAPGLVRALLQKSVPLTAIPIDVGQ